MPQPFTRILPEPYIILDETYWLDKPDVTGVVAMIFATWAKIETELGLMLVRILGADAAPALAMHEKLNTQSLRRTVLEAAASVALAEDDFDYFLSVMSVLDIVQIPRNHLAHWVWGHCKQKPKLLALADPKMVQETRQKTLEYFQKETDDSKIEWNRVYEIAQYDASRIMAYSTADLNRALRDLTDAARMLTLFESILDPSFSRTPMRVLVDFSPVEARAELFRQLFEQRLFREALARVRNAKGRKNTPLKRGGSPKPNPQAS